MRPRFSVTERVVLQEKCAITLTCLWGQNSCFQAKKSVEISSLTKKTCAISYFRGSEDNVNSVPLNLIVSSCVGMVHLSAYSSCLFVGILKNSCYNIENTLQLIVRTTSLRRVFNYSSHMPLRSRVLFFHSMLGGRESVALAISFA